ncbi:MAG TPA: beta-L-arabinofuranosidase domain-containing protein [Vicinamibacterales bacterium]|nr:beta-L-arabinofuranosidase domain-containing protein [Vicinamibacterales bacterium]
MKTATVVTLLGCVALTAFSRQYWSSTKIADKVTSAAIPFALEDVRLLDGPYRDAMIRDEQYLLSLDQDRLLHNFRVTAELPSNAQPLGGWESPDTELRGHAVGHYLSAVSIMYASTGDERFKAKADSLVTGFAKVQEAESRKFHAGYLSAFPEEFFDRVEARQRVWAPYYTIHKIMAGLLDAYLLAHNSQALDVLKKQADWVYTRNARLTEDQRQAMLQTEQGGMVEVLANLYAVTGDERYLQVAHMFEHKRILDPLANGIDPLDNVHANTQIPKIIGSAREYELTGDKRDYEIATFFWDRVVHHRTFVMGGNSDDETFFPEEETSHHLGAAGPETCNTYNMLKLTRHLFAWRPSAETMDFYERALLNHILGSQDPKTGGVLYYCPLKPGAFKTFSTADNSFWCCVGTGMENHAKYNDSIYFHSNDSAAVPELYVNLFIPSELTWKAQALTVRQLTKFPEEDSTSLTFTTAKPVKLAVKVRYPAWATSGMLVDVNGHRQQLDARPGSYVSFEREWKTGDTLHIRLPMSLHLERLPDDPHVQALMYGPVVLAGDLGTAGLEAINRYGPSAPPVGRVPRITVPSLVANSSEQVLAHVKPVAGRPLTFQTSDLAQPKDVTLIPLYKTFEPRYTVYWTVYTPAEYEKVELDAAALAAHRKDVDGRTIDAVDVSSDASERAHGFASADAGQGFVEGRRWRDTRTGFISYTLRVQPDQPLTLVCTFRGSEGQRRSFDVLVDGQKVATENLEYHPTELLDREYVVPEALTHAKHQITVRLVPHADARTGGVVEIRTVQPGR